MTPEDLRLPQPASPCLSRLVLPPPPPTLTSCHQQPPWSSLNTEQGDLRPLHPGCSLCLDCSSSQLTWPALLPPSSLFRYHFLREAHIVCAVAFIVQLITTPALFTWNPLTTFSFFFFFPKHVSLSNIWCSVFIVLNCSFFSASLMHVSFKKTKSSSVLFTYLSKRIHAFTTVLSIQWVLRNYCPKSEWIRKERNECLLSCLLFMFISISVVSPPNCELQKCWKHFCPFLVRILT